MRKIPWEQVRFQIKLKLCEMQEIKLTTQPEAEKYDAAKASYPLHL